jgi:hypothetical protein
MIGVTECANLEEFVRADFPSRASANSIARDSDLRNGRVMIESCDSG